MIHNARFLADFSEYSFLVKMTTERLLFGRSSILTERHSDLCYSEIEVRLKNAYTHTHIYRCPRRNVPDFERVYRYNPKHLCPKLNGYGDNGQRKVWSSCGSTRYRYQLTLLISYVLECDVISPHTSSCECADRNVTSESASLQCLETLRQL
jgi:hypothetical protein